MGFGWVSGANPLRDITMEIQVTESNPYIKGIGAWDVYAIHKGKRKRVAQGVGVFRATKKAAEIRKMGLA